MSVLFPVCGSKSRSRGGRATRERKRRRRLRASVFALALPLSLGPGWALWVAVPKASASIRGPQRRLLGSLLQENTEILGYLLGGIAAFGSWASRIPPLSRICRGKTFPSIHLWTRFLSALAGLLYASAIVAHDRQPEYLLRATPWFLTSLGRAALDLAIIFLSCVMKSKMRRALGFAAEAREGPDTQALLTCAEKEEENLEARTEDKNPDWVPLTTLSHCKSLRTTAAISRYMELTIEPVQQNKLHTPCQDSQAPPCPGPALRLPGCSCLSTCPLGLAPVPAAQGASLLCPEPPPPVSSLLRYTAAFLIFQKATEMSPSPEASPATQAGCSATRLPGDGQTSAGDAPLQEPPSYPPVQVIRARVSSSSSSEVSSINSDLEWDPEDVNLGGSKDSVEMLRLQVHGGSLRPVDLTPNA